MEHLVVSSYSYLAFTCTYLVEVANLIYGQGFVVTKVVAVEPFSYFVVAFVTSITGSWFGCFVHLHIYPR